MDWSICSISANSSNLEGFMKDYILGMLLGLSIGIYGPMVKELKDSKDRIKKMEKLGYEVEKAYANNAKTYNAFREHVEKKVNKLVDHINSIRVNKKVVVKVIEKEFK